METLWRIVDDNFSSWSERDPIVVRSERDLFTLKTTLDLRELRCFNCARRRLFELRGTRPDITLRFPGLFPFAFRWRIGRLWRILGVAVVTAARALAPLQAAPQLASYLSARPSTQVDRTGLSPAYSPPKLPHLPFRDQFQKQPLR